MLILVHNYAVHPLHQKDKMTLLIHLFFPPPMASLYLRTSVLSSKANLNSKTKQIPREDGKLKDMSILNEKMKNININYVFSLEILFFYYQVYLGK